MNDDDSFYSLPSVKVNKTFHELHVPLDFISYILYSVTVYTLVVGVLLLCFISSFLPGQHRFLTWHESVNWQKSWINPHGDVQSVNMNGIHWISCFSKYTQRPAWSLWEEELILSLYFCFSWIRLISRWRYRDNAECEESYLDEMITANSTKNVFQKFAYCSFK